MKLTVTGTDALRKKLQQNGRLEAVKRVVKMNGAELQAKAQRNAPVDTGTLKRSISLELRDGVLTAESEATAEYAPYVEWGTRFMNAQPFMRPAYYAQKEQFKSDLSRLMK
nr:MAG TPA: putative tail component [Caudoviricetes sp.]